MNRSTDTKLDLAAGRRLLASVLAATLLLGSMAFAGSSGAATADAASRVSAGASKEGAKRNPLYRAKALRSAGCAAASQVPLADAASLQAYYSSVLPCLNKAWKRSWKPLAKAGLKFRAPKVAVHDGQPKSPCANSGPLSFYCPINRTIYMYDREIIDPWYAYDNDYSHGLIRLGATHTLAHEYGHHVQELSGILRAIKYRYTGQTGRRLELQASCLGNAWLSAQSDAYPILADYGQRPEDWRYIAVSEHGSFASQKLWTDAGYASPRPRTCNTFKAPAAQVS